MSRAYRVVLPSFILASLGILACRTDEDGAGGAGATSGSTTGSKGTTTSTMTTTTGSNTTSTMSSGTGGQVGCSGDEHTVKEMSDGSLGPGIKVTLKGVVAMSQLFLVSGSGADPSSCLWGVFVSAPGLTETGPNTGVIALSYGTEPSIPVGSTDGKAYCPALGKDPAVGSAFADDVKPGDVLDLVGVTDKFPNDFANCSNQTPPVPANTVGMIQLKQVCSATKTGTAPVPAPHVLSAAELALLGSTTDAAFHDQWAAVKVRIEDTTLTAIDDFGMTLDGTIDVARKAWYRPLSPNKQCHGKDLNYMTGQVFDHVDGFHYLDFCSWGIAPSDRCGEFSPTSSACTAAGTTTCVDVK